MPVNNSGLFDYKTLERELDVDCAVELGRSFLEDTKTFADELARAIVQAEFETVRAVAHKLKGACRSINAMKVEDASSHLEDAARSADAHAVSQNHQALLPLYTALVDEITSYLKSK